MGIHNKQLIASSTSNTRGVNTYNRLYFWKEVGFNYIAKKMYSGEYNCYEVSYWARAPCYSNEMAGDASKQAEPECGKYLDV